MLRGRRFASEQDIERHISNGFGAGAGASYVPWLRVQDVPSRGRSHKIQGVVVDRIHHLFSDLERAYLLVCEFSEDVVDIREQYPLLPRESAKAIANSIGVRYPKYPTTSVPLVMTTDFILTVRQPNGDSKTVAKAIKYQVDLTGKESLRTLEKLEIERRFWLAQGIDWGIVTEKDFTVDLIKNLGLLRQHTLLPRELNNSSLLSDFVDHLVALKAYPWSTGQCLRKVASRLCLSYSSAKHIFYYLIWWKMIRIDLANTLLLLTSPLPDFTVISLTESAPLSEKSL